MATNLARLPHSQGKRRESGDLQAPLYNRFTEGFETKVVKDARVLPAEQVTQVKKSPPMRRAKSTGEC